MRNIEVINAILFLLVGLLSSLLAIFSPHWLLGSSQASYWVKHLGQQGARAFYIILGVLFIAAAVYIYFAKPFS